MKFEVIKLLRLLLLTLFVQSRSAGVGKKKRPAMPSADRKRSSKPKLKQMSGYEKVASYYAFYHNLYLVCVLLLTYKIRGCRISQGHSLNFSVPSLNTLGSFIF